MNSYYYGKYMQQRRIRNERTQERMIENIGNRR